jgi:hypothetical protein
MRRVETILKKIKKRVETIVTSKAATGGVALSLALAHSQTARQTDRKASRVTQFFHHTPV